MNYYRIEVYKPGADEKTTRPRDTYTVMSKQPEELAIENIMKSVRIGRGHAHYIYQKIRGKAVFKITNLKTKKIYYRKGEVYES